MIDLTPLQCFLIGIAFSLGCAAILGIFMKRSLDKLRSDFPDGVPPTVPKTKAPVDSQLQERIEALENRIEVLEQMVHNEMKA
jgi:hypothetical protein